MPIELVIVTPDGQAYAGPVEQVVLPGSEGDFGVLEKHERTLAPLKHGPVEIRTASGSEWAAIANGFAEVAGERVVVLADSCVLASKVNRTKVEAAKAEAEAELNTLAPGDETLAHRESLEEKIFQLALQLEISAK